MDDKNKMFYKKSDFLIIAAIILISLAAWAAFMLLTEKDNLYAQIYLNNKLVKIVNLTTAQNGFFSVEGKPDVVFEIKDGKIRFYESSCPDKICIRTGFLDRNRQSAACLPNKMILKIVSEKNTDDPDVIVR